MYRFLLLFLFFPFFVSADTITFSTSTSNPFSITTNGTETISVWARVICDDCASNDTIRLLYDGVVVDSHQSDTDSSGDVESNTFFYVATPPAQTVNLSISTVTGVQTLESIRYTVMRVEPGSDGGGGGETTFPDSYTVDNPAFNVFAGMLVFLLFAWFAIWFFSKRK